MKKFNIHPRNRDQPEESTKITINENGVERAEYDLSMDCENIFVHLKVKIYSTTSSFDVQGVKPHFSTLFEELGNRTIAVYFVDVILESIFQSMRNKVNLEDFNEHVKSQAKIGLEVISKPLNKDDTKVKKTRAKSSVVTDKKCNICDSNSRELNSFKCNECDKLFHKQCVNKRTSPKEFALLKKGDLSFNCETCVKSRIGINTEKSEIGHDIKALDYDDPNLKALSYDNTETSNDDSKEVEQEVGSTGSTGSSVVVAAQMASSTNSSESVREIKDNCEKCEKLETRVEHLESQIQIAHEAAAQVNSNVEKLVKEKKDLERELEAERNAKDSENVRSEMDLDRMKFLYEKLVRDNSKLIEKHNKELEAVVAQKMESDDKYNAIVQERERFRETERILLNTFDLWREKFESKKVQETHSTSTSSSPQQEILYTCDECVYEAITLTDLNNHKTEIHNEDLKCKVCGIPTLTESDLEGHMKSYHVEDNIQKHESQIVYLCSECDEEFEVKTELENHMQSKHDEPQDTMCDKCNYAGENIRDMEGHRKAEHSYFVYFCSACDYETSNFSILKQHKQTKHRYITTGTEKRKLSPPPKCNPRNKNHSSECCDRNPNQGKALIYTNEERQQNGICLNWNRGDCPNFELCKFLHIEIEACRYQNNCSRTNCKYWHNINGKFPFLWDARPRQMGEN